MSFIILPDAATSAAEIPASDARSRSSLEIRKAPWTRKLPTRHPMKIRLRLIGLRIFIHPGRSRTVPATFFVFMYEELLIYGDQLCDLAADRVAAEHLYRSGDLFKVSERILYSIVVARATEVQIKKVFAGTANERATFNF